MRNILCVATEWFSKNGGLSTFNRIFCETLAKKCNVFCYLPEFSDDESNDAKKKNIQLIKPKKIAGIIGIDSLSSIPLLPDDIQIHIVVGHDRITGPSMQALCSNYFKEALRILFIHTVPIEIEWLKPEQNQSNPAAKVEEKERIQIELAKESSIIFAVGPKLFLEFLALTAGLETVPKILRFDPGLYKPLNKIDYSFSSPIPESLVIGRLDDFYLKGVDIAAEAMATVHNKWDLKSNGIVLKPRLLVRGASVGSEKELLEKLNNLVPGSFLNFQIRSYSADKKVINEEIRRAGLLLMPSRAEGFGLVGLEAISSGRPILISENSGLAMLLQEIAPEEVENWVIPRELPNNGIDRWAENITVILKDRDAAGRKLQKLAEIYVSKVSWENSVDYLLNEIGKFESNKQPSIGSEYKDERKESLDSIDSVNNNEYKQWVIQMEAGSKLVRGFLALSGTKRFGIAKELGLIEPGETFDGAILDRMSSKFIERAYKRNLLDQLWAKVFNDSKDSNPFINK